MNACVSAMNQPLVDKAAWLAVYEEDGLVQDPVGVSRFDATGGGHRGRAAISAFWDVFMENQESFDYTIHHTAIGFAVRS